MGKINPSGDEREGLGSELEALLAKARPPQAPAWFVAKTLARLRQEQGKRKSIGDWFLSWRWVGAAGIAVALAGWILWDRSQPGIHISDAEVFAALDALVQQEEENRWWVGL